jgi:O-antigen/teichoic acid export membrane protein
MTHPASEPSVPTAPSVAKKSPVLKNTLILVGGQLAGTPLMVLLNAIMGRYLGPAAFGHLYLATTVMRLGFLFVEWGHSGVMPAAVARDRSRAGEYLGTSLVWRLASALLICVTVTLAAPLAGYEGEFQLILGLVALQSLLGALTGACQDVVRGFERTDVTAGSQLASQILSVVVVIPVLMLGGGLIAALVAQAAVGAVVSVVTGVVTLRAGVVAIAASKRALKELFQQGSYFLSFGIAMMLQANVDTVFLSKLTPVEVVGWQGATQRLAGVLVIPASALITALYPTLSRLHVENRGDYSTTVRKSLRGALLLAVPMAACCALYRDLGVQLFSEASFGPARQNLLVFSVFLPLVYLGMTIGVALLAAGRQRAWAGVQLVAVAVSLGLDPLLIPWFQTHYGNGGIGVCVAAVLSEVLKVGIGLWMLEKGVLDGSLLVALAKAAAAGVAMLGAGVALQWLTPFVAAPIVLLVYAAALSLVRGISREEIEPIRNAIARRLAR